MASDPIITFKAGRCELDGKKVRPDPTPGYIYLYSEDVLFIPERHFFWMQAKSQHKDGTPSWFSARDQRIGEIINQLLAGEDVDVENEVQNIQNGGDDDQGGDDDIMEDVEDTQPDHHRQGSGGAGPDATGGDPREEGEDSRRGGEDGGRA
ncbi:hypothetical protein H2203_004159 [Taxawa tesnikishii (nom. ined.)]|nr:hypothetical protein H2203_004159 [Dothideales sp. JES 119]